MKAVEIPENAVILIQDPSDTIDDAAFADMATALHERFPSNPVVWLSGDTTFQTLPADEAKQILRDIIAHEEARDSQSSR